MRTYDSPARDITIVNGGPGAIAVLGNQPYRRGRHMGITSAPAAIGEELVLSTAGAHNLTVQLVDGAPAQRVGDMVYLSTDGQGRLVAGYGDAGAPGMIPFGVLCDPLTATGSVRVKLLPVSAPDLPSLMFGTPNGYDAATGKTNALPLPVDESQFLVSVADGVIYRRVSVTSTVFLPPTFTPQVITYKRWDPVSAALNLKLQTPSPTTPIAQAANADGSLLVPLIHPSVTSNPAFVSGRRFTPSSGATYVELKPEAGRVRIEGLLNGITGGTAADYVKVVSEISADDGATWQASSAFNGFDTADARVADVARFRSEPIFAPGNGLVRISVRYVSTAAAQFYVNNIWLKAA